MKIETAKAIMEWEDDDDAENFEEISSAKMVSQSRWSGNWQTIYRDKRNGSFWRISWSRGLPDHQDEGPQSIKVVQVWPEEKTVIEYTTTQPVAA